MRAIRASVHYPRRTLLPIAPITADTPFHSGKHEGHGAPLQHPNDQRRREGRPRPSPRISRGLETSHGRADLARVFIARMTSFLASA